MPDRRYKLIKQGLQGKIGFNVGDLEENDILVWDGEKWILETKSSGGGGTDDHTLLINRDAANQHPQSAITDLVADQGVQDTAIGQNASDLSDHAGDASIHFADAPSDSGTYGRVQNAWAEVTPTIAFNAHVNNHSNPHQVTYADLPDQPTIPPAQTYLHDDLTDVGPDQHHSQAHDHSDGDPSGTVSHVDIKNRSAQYCHPTAAITGLDNDQIAQDEATALVQTNLDAHEGDTGNPHGVQHSQLGGITTDDHHSEEHLLYGVNHNDVDTTDPLEIRDILEYTGTNIAPGRRVHDRGAYVSGQTYYVMDQAMQEGYVGIAKVETTDPIAPVPVGDVFWPTDGAVGATDFDQLEVATGNSYTLTTTASADTVRVFVEASNVGHPHTLVVKVNGVTIRTIAWTPTAAGYDQVQTAGGIAFAGDVVSAYVTVTNDTGNERVYYEHDDGYWTTYTNPLFSAVTGYYNGATNANAYGVDAQFQEITASEDWHRISSPAGGSTGSAFTPDTFTGADSTGYVPDPLVEQDYFLADDGTFKAAPVSPIGGTFLNMTFDGNTDTTTQPNDGDVRVDDGGDHLAATQLAASDITAPGNDAGVIWDNVHAGDYIGLWETSGDHEGVNYVITGVTDMGGWRQLAITAIGGQSNTGIDNNRALQVYFIKNPLNTLPPGGNDGDVLTKGSGADYDTDWETPIVYPTEAENDARYPIRDNNFTNIEIVAALPGVTDPNTLYFIVP